MKSKLSSIISVIILFLFSSIMNAQHQKEDLESKYVTVITLHGVEGADFDEWLKVEKEYFDKVTSKIEIIVNHDVLVRYFGNGLTEIKVINVFESWNDIEYVNNIRESLIKQVWPDEGERAAFFEKQNSFYTNYHSDEIYVTTNLSKLMPGTEKASLKNPMVYYIDTNILSDNDNGNAYKIYEEYLNAVVYKNSYIKAYYPLRHHWGADSREFLEIYVVNSLTNLEKAFEMDKQLFQTYMPDKVKRKEFLKTYSKTVSGHKDGLYRNVPVLTK